MSRSVYQSVMSRSVYQSVYYQCTGQYISQYTINVQVKKSDTDTKSLQADEQISECTVLMMYQC